MKDFAEENEFTKLEKSIEDVLNENNLQSVLYFSKIQTHWEIIVGPSLAAKTSPAILRNHVLTVIVEDAAYSHHLKYFEKNIRDLISSPEICGEGVVKKIVFNVGKPSRHQTPIPRVSKTDSRPPKPVEMKEEAVATASSITDRNLKAAFARLMTHRLSKTTDEI